MTEPSNDRYRADIRWTTHGVAHVTAGDWASLGFGQGWACARDHLGILADQVVKVRGERARYHGPGIDDHNVVRDLGYRALDLGTRAADLRAAQSPVVQSVVEGYVAGHNAYLAEAVAEGSVPRWCRGAEWLRPIDVEDYYRVLVDVMILASGRNLVGVIGLAEPPGPDGPRPAAPLEALTGPVEGAGSNAWAFGSRGTASGGGLLLANPHFPWNGEARFWESHLILESDGHRSLDVYGVGLVGMPGVQIGFNSHVAWTHTVSKGHRFTIAKLDLVEGSPTEYRFGDEQRMMVPSAHRIEVLGGEEVERTVWCSHHGPMLNLPLLGWSETTAFTYRDANLDNVSAFPTWMAMMQARSIDDMKDAFAEHQGIPWVNTLAVDRSGRAWYIDGSATPKLTGTAQRRFVERLGSDLVAALLFENRVALLDGSEPDDEWVEADGARSPGLVPYADQPQLERDDVLVNANDSAWSTNLDEPLTDHQVLHGLERVPFTQRTRRNHLAARAQATQGATIDSVLAAMFDNVSGTADLAPAVAVRLREAGMGTEADVLEGWDGRYELGSRGAAFWRELMAGFTPAQLLDGPPLWAKGFDPDDPLSTPSGLAVAPPDGPDPVVVAARTAVDMLARAGVALDAPLGEVQWVTRGKTRVPMHGGGEPDAVANIMTASATLRSTTLQPPVEAVERFPERLMRTGLGPGGYSCIYGASIVLAVEMTSDGPTAKGLLAYGQSSDPDRPDTAEQAEAFSAKRWRTISYTDAAIEEEVLDRCTVSG
ncbi:MAG: penicillin acylase family protein [Acidimicrobiales bacterium]|nr:penicillin acylase family protein [Acidimicrobiales bacterium]